MSATGEGHTALSARDVGWRGRVLLAVGFAGLIAFSRLFSLGFVGYLDRGMLVSADGHYVARTMATVLMLALLALAGRNSWFSVGSKLLALATAGMIGAVAVFALDLPEEFGFATAVIGGASNAVMLFAWMLLLSSFRIRRIVESTLVGLALAGIAIGGAPVLGPVASLVIAALSALVAGAVVFALDADMSSLQADGALTRTQFMRVPWLTFVLMLACSLFSGVLHGVAMRMTWLYDWSPNLFAFGLSAGLVVGGTVAVMMRSRAWMHIVWVPLFALFSLVLVLACLSTRELMSVVAGLTMGAVFCANFLPWSVFPSMFSTLKVPRAFLLGVVLMVTNSSLATLAGDALASALPASMQNLGSVSGVMAIALAALFAIAFVAFRQVIGAVGVRLSREARTASGAYATSEAFEGREARAASEVLEGRKARAMNEAPEAHEAHEAPEAPEAPGPLAPPDPPQPPDPAADEPAQPSPLDALRERVDALVGEYGLTPRETEVALLTVQGFSCAYIAEKLVVSNSTVRFHQQNIYRKLDVHSRNELIELVSA